MVAKHVVIRAFRGIALNRWCVGFASGAALITNEDGAAAVNRGRTPEYVLGFPSGDVFEPPDTGITDGDSPNWAEMRLYSPIASDTKITTRRISSS